MSFPLLNMVMPKEPVAWPRLLQPLLTHLILCISAHQKVLPYQRECRCGEVTHEEGDADGGNDSSPEEEEIEQDDSDVVIEEQYYKQQEKELDYEDDAPTKELEQAADVDESEQAADTKVKQAVIWGWLGEPVDERTSTNTETGEMANLMESVLGIQSPEGRCQTNEENVTQHSCHNSCQHTVLSNDSR